MLMHTLMLREGEYSVSVRYPNGTGKPVRHFKLVSFPLPVRLLISFVNIHFDAFKKQVCDPDSTCEWVMWGEKFRSLQDFVHFFQVLVCTSRY